MTGDLVQLRPAAEDEFDADPGCARCGSSTSWEDCENCGGEGCYEAPDDDSWAFVEDPLWCCDVCQSKGGWWACLSSPEWCEANPLPGHEQAKRTA